MKAKWNLAEAILLGPAAAWGAVGCVVSVYALPMQQEQLLCAAAILWAVCCAFLSGRKLGRILLPALCAAGILAALAFGGLREQLPVLARVLSAAVSGQKMLVTEDMTAAAGMAGGLLIAACADTVRSGSRRWLPVLLMLLCLAPCIVVSGQAPNPACLAVTLGCLFLLLLNDDDRAPQDASRLAFLALIPTAAALALLLSAVPQQTYVNQARVLREALAEATARTLQGLGLMEDGTAAKIDLMHLPELPEAGETIAEVRATEPGVFYLRVQDYDRYTGTSWEASANRTETLSGLGDPLGTVTIVMRQETDALLLPSFPAGEILLSSGAALQEPDGQTQIVDVMSKCLGAQPGQEWLELPEALSRAALLTAMRIVPEGADTQQAAGVIAAYVSSAATYSTVPERVPAGTEDFSEWFLEEAQSGYCTHFATAATVLLRAYGIPARYVTGYRVVVHDRETVPVTVKEAHAWVEYYNYATWTWTILEATPGLTEPDAKEAPETPPTQETTQPPETSETTQPPETTEPPAPPEPDGSGRAHWLWLLLLLLPELQRLVRRWLRRRRQTRGPQRSRALLRWREISRMSVLAGVRAPASLEELAQQAAYSAREPDREALAEMDAGMAALRRRLRRLPWYRRLVIRYVYAEL